MSYTKISAQDTTFAKIVPAGVLGNSPIKVSKQANTYNRISKHLTGYAKLSPNTTTYTAPTALFPLGGLLIIWDVGNFVWNSLQQNWED